MGIPVPKLQPYVCGAGEGNRTLVLSLEGFSSTIELHPANPTRSTSPATAFHLVGKGSNLRRLSRQIYSLFPLTAWVSLGRERLSGRLDLSKPKTQSRHIAGFSQRC